MQEIQAPTLKAFKTSLLQVIRKQTIRDTQMVIRPESLEYRAEEVRGVLILYIPGCRTVEGEPQSISRKAIEDRMQTIQVFLQKRI